MDMVLFFLPGALSAVVLFGFCLWALDKGLSRLQLTKLSAPLVFFGSGIVLWALCAVAGFLIFFQLLMEIAGHVALGAFVFSYVPISALVFVLAFFRSKSRRSRASNSVYGLPPNAKAVSKKVG